MYRFLPSFVLNFFCQGAAFWMKVHVWKINMKDWICVKIVEISKPGLGFFLCFSCSNSWWCAVIYNITNKITSFGVIEISVMLMKCSFKWFVSKKKKKKCKNMLLIITPAYLPRKPWCFFMSRWAVVQSNSGEKFCNTSSYIREAVL